MNETILNFGQQLTQEITGGQCNVLSGMMMGSIMSVKFVLSAMALMVVYSFIQFGIKEWLEWLKQKINNWRKK